MFGKRKERIEFNVDGKALSFTSPLPRKKEFETMLELLRDAQKFDDFGEKYVSHLTLKNLSNFIENYIEKDSSKQKEKKQNYE
jgi:hypothetical protein